MPSPSPSRAAGLARQKRQRAKRQAARFSAKAIEAALVEWLGASWREYYDGREQRAVCADMRRAVVAALRVQSQEAR